MKNMTALSVLVITPAVATYAGAQGARVLDRGAFTISVNGVRAGREDFTIGSTPAASGSEFLSHAKVSYGDRRLNPKLMTDSAGRPSRYEIEVQGTSGTTEQWRGMIVRGRVSAKMENTRGTSEREYVVADGALLVDDDVFHQYYFLVQRASRGSIPIVVPRRNAQMVLRASTPVEVQVTVAGTDLPARHYVFTEPGGATREVWVDPKGRVLKVEIPARGIVALREDPPAN